MTIGRPPCVLRASLREMDGSLLLSDERWDSVSTGRSDSAARGMKEGVGRGMLGGEAGGCLSLIHI